MKNVSATSSADGTLTVTAHPYSAGQGVRIGSAFYTLEPGTSFGDFECGLRGGITYYVLNPTPNTFQLGLTPDGPPVPVLDRGAGCLVPFQIIDWPPPANPVVVRTAVDDSQLPPPGVRIDPSWSASMATLTATGASGNYNPALLALGFAPLANNWRFVGLHLTIDSTASAGASTDPLPHWGWFQTAPDASFIVFDRCWFDGLSYPDRIVRGSAVWDGAYMAVIDSYMSNVDYWRPYSNIVPTTTSTTLTVNAGTFNLGNKSCTIAAPLPAFTVTGGSASTAGALWMNSDCSLGLELGADITGTWSNCPTCGFSAVTTPSFPVSAVKEYLVGLIAQPPMSSGHFTGAGTVASFSYSKWNTEGASALFAQFGPGPYKLSNTFVQCVGICTYWSDDGGGRVIASDITITRNLFSLPLSKMAGGPQTDGRKYSHRQFLEVKVGQRINIDGNQFFNNIQEVTPNGYAVLLTGAAAANPGLSANVTQDINYTNNTISNSAGGIQFNAVTVQSYIVAHNMRRVLVANNLFQGIDGRLYSSSTGFQGTGGAAGVVLSTSSGGEDFVMQHNTATINRGIIPSLYAPYVRPIEGFVFRDNLGWVNTDGANQGVFYSAATQSGGGSDSSPTCP